MAERFIYLKIDGIDKRITPRQVLLVRTLAEDIEIKEAAAKLHISYSWALEWISRTYLDFGVLTRVGLVMKGIELGLVTIGPAGLRP